MRRTALSLLAAGFGVAVLLLAAPAGAHEGKVIGRYTFVVGFGDEPAYAGAKNSVEVLVSDARGRPVTDIGGDDLRVMVMAGGKELELPLEPYFEVGEWGIPGDYRAFFVPTAPGRYSFHLHGKVDGQKIDQRFTSGPNSFPVKDPTTGQLAARLDREVPRLAVASAQAARAAERRARQAADQARLLAVAGLVVGVAGLLAGGLALARSRRPVPAAPRPEVAVGAGKL